MGTGVAAMGAAQAWGHWVVKIIARTEAPFLTVGAGVAIVDAAAIADAQLALFALEIGALSAFDVCVWSARRCLPLGAILAARARLTGRCARAVAERQARFARDASLRTGKWSD